MDFIFDTLCNNSIKFMCMKFKSNLLISFQVDFNTHSDVADYIRYTITYMTTHEHFSYTDLLCCLEPPK